MTPLYRLFEAPFDDVRGQREERFEKRYGFWRGFVDDRRLRYLDCGLFGNGFSRVRCPDCHEEYLLASSSAPSVPAHAQWDFVIPKMLRPDFLHHRELLGKLSKVAWETVIELMVTAVGEEAFRPGMVAVVQTAGDKGNWHPHVHAIVSRGGWSSAGEWIPIGFVDEQKAEWLFRHKVMRYLQNEGLLSEERAELLLSWRHTDFSVHNRVTVEPEDQRDLVLGGGVFVVCDKMVS